MENIVKFLVCPLSDLKNEHFFDKPKILPCCGRSACNKCIIKFLRTSKSSVVMSEFYYYHCPLCDVDSKIELNKNGDECKLKSDTAAENELKNRMSDINYHLISKLENSVKYIEEKFQRSEKLVEKRKEYIENEILVQIELLKCHLESLEAELKEKLNDSCQNTKQNLQKLEKSQRPNLDYLKECIQSLKQNQSNFVNDLKFKENKSLLEAMQCQSLNKCLSVLNETTEITTSFNEIIDELKFYPNIETPNVSIIGQLKKVKEINHIENFKNLNNYIQVSKIRNGNNWQAITPRYLCVADQFNLLFTDSQSKQLVQISLETGEFIRSTNLNGVLKNPDGVCVNRKTGHIYLSDNETKTIFKLDAQFNLIKRFGQKELKWPRGIFYDSELMNNVDGSSTPDRLYVCDYSAQKVMLFNEHDQLRGCLAISLSDDLPNSPSNINRASSFNYDDDLSKFYPLNVCANKSLIYVSDDWNGGNCIRVFDKRAHTLLMNVKDLNCWNPLGVFVDHLGNIFTMARVHYETGLTSLFCFDKDGKLLYKTSLNISNEVIADIALDNYTDVVNHRIICCGEKQLHFLKFE